MGNPSLHPEVGRREEGEEGEGGEEGQERIKEDKGEWRAGNNGGEEKGG